MRGKTQGRILVVEDEVNLASGIRENLKLEGYSVDVAADGVEGLERIRSNDYDLVVLDVMMPRLDGVAVCKVARAEGIQGPVLVLTAKSSVDDRIRGLEAGGDDYLPKPFHLRELLARVGSIMRRRGWYGGPGDARGCSREGVGLRAAPVDACRREQGGAVEAALRA